MILETGTSNALANAVIVSGFGLVFPFSYAEIWIGCTPMIFARSVCFRPFVFRYFLSAGPLSILVQVPLFIPEMARF